MPRTWDGGIAKVDHQPKLARSTALRGNVCALPGSGKAQTPNSRDQGQYEHWLELYQMPQPPVAVSIMK